MSDRKFTPTQSEEFKTILEIIASEGWQAGSDEATEETVALRRIIDRLTDACAGLEQRVTNLEAALAKAEAPNE